MELVDETGRCLSSLGALSISLGTQLSLSELSCLGLLLVCSSLKLTCIMCPPSGISYLQAARALETRELSKL